MIIVIAGDANKEISKYIFTLQQIKVKKKFTKLKQNVSLVFNTNLSYDNGNFLF